MKLYLNPLICLMMSKFDIDSYARAAGLYAIATQLEEEGYTSVLDYEAYTVMFGEELECHGIDLKAFIDYVGLMNTNPSILLPEIKPGGKK